MLEKLKNKMIEKQNLSDNKCGITRQYLSTELGISYTEMSKLLNQLYSEKFITIKEGINNKLIFLKNGNKKRK